MAHPGQNPIILPTNPDTVRGINPNVLPVEPDPSKIVAREINWPRIIVVAIVVGAILYILSTVLNSNTKL